MRYPFVGQALSVTLFTRTGVPVGLTCRCGGNTPMQSPDIGAAMTEFSQYSTQQQAEGAGARVNRAFPTAGHDHLDPFVLLDEFFVGDDGFPEHPHQGFEIITYMLEGAFEHTDTTGASETIRAGGAQRLRVGSGLRHSERPGTSDPDHGLQLWINLPRDGKDTDPHYLDADRDALPVDARDGVTVTTIVGEGSPLDLRADVRYELVEVAAGATYTWAVNSGWSALLYPIAGTVTIPTGTVAQGEFASRNGRDQDTGDPATVRVEATTDATVAAITGAPFDEPITQRGPVVL